MSSDDLGRKHLNIEARRRRFDPGSKYGGRGGATLVKAMPESSISADGYSEIFLKTTRPTDAEGNVMVSKVDQEFPDLLDDQAMSGGRLFQLPEILEAECVAMSTRRSRELHDIIVTTYTLEGVDWMAPAEEERIALAKKREARLSLVQNVIQGDGDSKRRVFCRLRDTPLERITEPTLLDHRSKFSSPYEAPGTCCAKARVLADHSGSCWSAPLRADGDPASNSLQVDLGEDCRVTWVSTQGRFPLVKGTDKETGIRVVHDPRHWVTFYEVSYRVSSGREWVVLAERVKGNTDATSEVAHAVGQLTSSREPLRCRYLRFRPLEYCGQPAMRVGVYGERPAEADGPWRREVAPTESQVQYTIFRMKQGTNRRKAPGGCGGWRAGCNRCGRFGMCSVSVGKDFAPSVRRRRFRRGVMQEVRPLLAAGGREQLPEDGEDFAPAQGPAARAAFEERGYGAGRPGSAASSGRPRFGRARSFSDPDLAPSAPSSSLGESFARVEAEALGSSADFDEDEWLVVPERP